MRRLLPVPLFLALSGCVLQVSTTLPTLRPSVTPASPSAAASLAPSPEPEPAATATPVATPRPTPTAGGPSLAPTARPTASASESPSPAPVSGPYVTTVTDHLFDHPTGVAVDAAGNVYVAEEPAARISRVTPNGDVEVFADESTAPIARPNGMQFAPDGTLIVADHGVDALVRIRPDGTGETLAGGSGQGLADGPAEVAQFFDPLFFAQRSDGAIAIADLTNNRVRLLQGGVVSTLLGDGSEALLHDPSGVASDQAGNLYVADFRNHRIRKRDVLGNLTTIAGTGQPGYADGPGATAQFDHPRSLILDPAGTLYVGEFGNNRVRRITPDGEVSTYAGSTSGYRDGPARDAQFMGLNDIALTPRGDMYVVEVTGHLRVIKAASY